MGARGKVKGGKKMGKINKYLKLLPVDVV